MHAVFCTTTQEDRVRAGWSDWRGSHFTLYSSQSPWLCLSVEMANNGGNVLWNEPLLCVCMCVCVCVRERKCVWIWARERDQQDCDGLSKRVGEDSPAMWLLAIILYRSSECQAQTLKTRIPTNAHTHTHLHTLFNFRGHVLMSNWASVTTFNDWHCWNSVSRDFLI